MILETLGGVGFWLPPVAGAAIGYGTNLLAIRMLFHPYRELRFLGWVVPFTPGLIPRERGKIAETIADSESGEPEEAPGDITAADPVEELEDVPEGADTASNWIKQKEKKPGGEKWQVYIVPIQDAVSKPTEFILKRALKQAIEKDIDAVILDMNTPGGRVDVTLEIMEMLDRFEGESITYVNTDAISAGSLIASSTDEIYFAPKSQIGAAAVIFSTGQDVPETSKQKLESYMRAKVRNYSETDPYRAKVIRAMMEADYVLEIDGKEVKPEGELLTLTGNEAMELYGDPPRPLLGAGIADTINDLLAMKYGVNPKEYVTVRDDHDAMLLIGNQALRLRRGADARPQLHHCLIEITGVSRR
mgnify:CR=1 FL=1